MTETSPEPPVWLDAADLYEGLDLPAGRGDRPYAVVNMISTVDGKAAVGGRAGPLGDPTDRVVMRQLRAAVDCILVGAGTIRAEAFRLAVSPEQAESRRQLGLLPQPQVAILTNTGDLPVDARAIFRPPSPRPLVFTSQHALREHAERFADLGRVAEVVPVGEEVADLACLMRVLHDEHGVRRLLVEGGPRLNQGLFAAGLVDELFLTLTPRVVGGHSRSIVEDEAEPRLDLARLELVSAARAGDELFLRYRVR